LQLEFLHFQDCDLQHDFFPIPQWSTVLSTGYDLAGLTSLQVHNVKPELHTNDLPALVNACPALKSLHTCTITEPEELTALMFLPQLTSLGVTVKDAGNAWAAAFAAIGQLAGLSELRVYGYCRASLGGLRELTALQQLTSLGFTAEMRAATFSETLAGALDGRMDGCRYTLVNKVRQSFLWDVFSGCAQYMGPTSVGSLCQ
jgi:hypothetical protein